MTSTHWLESRVATGAVSVAVASVELAAAADVDLLGLLAPDVWTTVLPYEQPAASVAVTATTATHHRFAIKSSRSVPATAPGAAAPP